MDERYRRPDERRETPVVADERREGDLSFTYVHYHVSGQEPRGGLEWVNESWMREVGDPAARQADPVAELLALARGHAVFCRRDIARVVMALRLEFSGQDHPVAQETERIWQTGVKRCAKLISAGRKAGSIPPGPPAEAVALAMLGAFEGAVIALAGHRPHDELLAARAVAGALGIDSGSVAS